MYWAKHLFVGLILSMVLSMGCMGTSDGGDGKIIIDQTISSLDKDGQPVSTHQIITLDVNQPTDPDKPAIANIQLPDGTMVGLNSGSAGSAAKIKASNLLLSPVIYVGIALVLVGAVSFIFTKNLVMSAILSGTGILLIVGSYLLAQYSFIILCVGLVLAVGAGIYLLWRYRVANTAAVENTKLINVIKEKLPDDSYNEVFYGKDGADPLTKTIQQPSTQKFVDQVKQKMKYGKKA